MLLTAELDTSRSGRQYKKNIRLSIARGSLSVWKQFKLCSLMKFSRPIFCSVCIFQHKRVEGIHLGIDREDQERNWKYIALLFLSPRHSIGVGGQRHAPAALPPWKTRYPLYRRLGGLQGRSGRVRRISPPPGFDLRTVQPVASGYADWAVMAME